MGSSVQYVKPLLQQQHTGVSHITALKHAPANSK